MGLSSSAYTHRRHQFTELSFASWSVLLILLPTVVIQDALVGMMQTAHLLCRSHQRFSRCLQSNTNFVPFFLSMFHLLLQLTMKPTAWELLTYLWNIFPCRTGISEHVHIIYNTSVRTAFNMCIIKNATQQLQETCKGPHNLSYKQYGNERASGLVG